MTNNQLTLEDFSYDLPSGFIAQYPNDDLNENRLLVRNPSGTFDHLTVANLPDVLPENSLVVVNDSKVFPSRIKGRLPTGGAFELMLIKPISESENTWMALGKPIKKLLKHGSFHISHDLRCEIIGRADTESQTFKVRFSSPISDLYHWLNNNGFVPLPPYIKREQEETASRSPDNTRYQTPFATNVGSVAAPTAGLHFSHASLDALKRRGIVLTAVTHHVGAGTFLPVKSTTPDKHEMHSESYLVTNQTDMLIKRHLADKKPIVLVGTTTFRCLESFYRQPHPEPNKWNSTNLFIYPNNRFDTYKPIISNAIITNFHQPCSTLFMLVSALIGLDQCHELYRKAIDMRYRFLSYGDASLIWLN